MTVRNRIAATKKASKPIAPVISGWETMRLPVRSICGCQNKESSMENAATMTAQKKIQKTSANGLKLISIFGCGISGMTGALGEVGGMVALGITMSGATLL